MEDPLDLSLHLTDGFCLVYGDRVLLNHHDIDYYDYGSHLIYLKSRMSAEKILEAGGDRESSGALSVYAGEEKIYTLTLQPGYSSLLPEGPVIRTSPTFYPDNVLAIGLMNSLDVLTGDFTDVREDPRIVEVLKKYGQYMEGLHAEIISVWYGAPDELRLDLKLSNRDEMNYYYLDPEKMGMGLYHYYTSGVMLLDSDDHFFYGHEVEAVSPYPWDGWELDWMSLLEGGESAYLRLDYNNFTKVPAGAYQVLFQFPGLEFQVERHQQNQPGGRIWLGKLYLRSELLVN